MTASLIRLAANSHALAGSLPEALASFMARHKGVFIQVREDLSAAIGLAVAEGIADLGVAGASVQFPNLDCTPFRSGGLGLLLPPGHPLAERHIISFAETLDYPQISLEEPSAISVFLSDQARLLGRDLVVPMRLRSFEGVCHMVAAGAGMSMVPSSVVSRATLDTGTRFVPLAEDWADCTLLLCMPRDRPVARIVKLLAEEITAAESHHPDFAREAWSQRERALELA